MTDTNPPADRIDEADAAIRAIATTKYHPAPWTSEYDSFGTDINLGPYFQVSDASGHFVAVTESEEVHTLLLNAADDINRLSARVEDLEGQLAAVDALHKPQRRYTTPDNYEASYDDPEWIVEAFDIPLEEVESFVVCEHCGGIEMRGAVDYREALWPCATAKARGITGDPDEH